MIASSSERGINNLTELRSFTDSNNNHFINNDDATATDRIVPLSPNFRSLFLHGVIVITITLLIIIAIHNNLERVVVIFGSFI
jgi:hypothetical protein